MLTIVPVVWFSLALVQPLAGRPPSAQGGRVELRTLVASDDPLSSQDLGFDASEARQAIEYLRTGDPALATAMADSAAIAHILAHARNFDYDVPKDSSSALVESLLLPAQRQAERTAVCEQSLAHFDGAMLSDPHWVNDVLRYLPANFHFHGTLFLTFGYDIGVAFAPNASLNCTHPHFGGQPRELLYYAIHELHHVGYMTFQRPPRLADIASCADLLALVEYSTQMEGMAVLAAYQRRREDDALGGDEDYAALGDAGRMKADLDAYFKEVDTLLRRGTQAADAQAWQVVTHMSSGERLWYRVGAAMARRIEAEKGRAALVDLVREGPAAFVEAYRALGSARDGRPAVPMPTGQNPRSPGT
jgi:hypothetical protein